MKKPLVDARGTEKNTGTRMNTEKINSDRVKTQEYEVFLTDMLRELEEYLKIMLSTIELYKKSRGIK